MFGETSGFYFNKPYEGYKIKEEEVLIWPGSGCCRSYIGMLRLL
jgi:hypothetical protein